MQVEYSSGGLTPVAIQTTARVMYEVMASSTQNFQLIDWGLEFDGSAAAAGILVELVYLTATGTGTAVTMEPVDTRDSRSWPGTSKYNDTVAPTVGFVQSTHIVPPTSMRDIWLPECHEFAYDVSKGFGIRVTGQSGNVPKCAPFCRIKA